MVVQRAWICCACATELLGVNAEMRCVAAVELGKGQAHIGQHTEAQTVGGLAVQGVYAVAQHLARFSAVGRCARFFAKPFMMLVISEQIAYKPLVTKQILFAV